MKRLLGPILHLRQGAPDEWAFDVGLWVRDATTDDLALEVDPGAAATADVKPTNHGTFAGGDWFSWRVRMPRRDDEIRTWYEIRGLGEPLRIDDVAVPKRGQAPRMAVVSCNGVQNKSDWTSRPEMEATWEALWQRHQMPMAPDGSGGPYHVLIGAGDQVYCDAVWEEIPELRELRTWKKRQAKKIGARLERQIEALYGRLYGRWLESTFFQLHARVPGIYTWDDHDIFDGFGSYDDELQDCDLFQAIYRCARRAFLLFQLGADDAGASGLQLDAANGHSLQAVRFDGELDILALDLRSHRTNRRVLGERQWSAIRSFLAERAASASSSHLIVVSSIPLVYLNLATAERVLQLLPWRQDLEDDLRDQWESDVHQEERARLIMTLLDHAAASETRVSIVSGDVHVGARGQIVSRRPEHLLDGETAAVIHQLTSSAIVYPPPGAFALAGMRAIANEGPLPLLAVSNVATEMLPVTGGELLLGENNWLSIEPDPDWSNSRQRLWIRWMTAKRDVKPPLVIHRRPV